jgi:hypothetical protein
VPRFVLAELQLIADSGDAMKRSRGRRGLEMLHTMRQAGVDMEIIEGDYSDIKEVDAKLVRMGREMQCNVLTTDYNLNRVASIEGVRVLNINELANAVRPVVIPGERMRTKIVQAGKERNQGVGYLADGTMIVVDGGDRLIGQEVEVEITRVFQTVAGKMLFAMLTGPVPVAQPKAQPRQRQARAQSPAPDQPQQSQVTPQSDQPKERSQSGGGRRRGRRGGQDGRQGSQPEQRQASRQTESNQAKPQIDKSGNGGRRKRVSPTQRLENSLVELTKHPEQE